MCGTEESHVLCSAGFWHDSNLCDCIYSAKMDILCVPHAKLGYTIVALLADKSSVISGVWHWRK